MAVQQNRKTRAKRNMRRAHDALRTPALSVDKNSKEVHISHHLTKDGFYGGRKVVALGRTVDTDAEAA